VPDHLVGIFPNLLLTSATSTIAKSEPETDTYYRKSVRFIKHSMAREI